MSQEIPQSRPVAKYKKESARSEDLDYVADCKAAFLEERMPLTTVLLLAVVGFVISFLIWAKESEINELARAHGKVVPTGSTQIVQSLEGGIVSELLVREGDSIQQGQLLAILDDTLFKSAYREAVAERNHLIAKIARLDAEALDLDIVPFPETIAKEAPDLIASEALLFKARREELKTNQKRLKASLELKNKELSITRPLANSGIVSQIELLRLETMVNDLEGQIERERSEYFSEVVSHSNEYKGQLRRIEESMLAYEDKVDRAEIKSPVSGIVNKIHINTIGGVLQPGASIVEIVPVNDNLLVEAHISPSDIGFIKPRQNATVKLTAYDFAVYGGLHGTVEKISADTFLDDTGKSYYKVLIRTGERSLKTAEETLEIIPGMIVQVDIKTGRKSVLDYILKPLMRAKMNAFTER